VEEVLTERIEGRGFDVFIHPSPNAKAIIINCPGYRGDINGYNDKHKKIGRKLSTLGVGAFIQAPNIEHEVEERAYYRGVVTDLWSTIEHARRNAKRICGTETPEIYLMGFSRGGAACAITAAIHSGVARVLLIEPTAYAVERDRYHPELTSYRGEVYIVVGQGRDAIGERVGALYQDIFVGAKRCELVVIPDCDHQFRGKTNGQILSKAPLWAFAGENTFPSPEGGMELY
jgi:dienelactone hydrolase